MTDGDLNAAPTLQQARRVVMVEAWPLVGRDDQLRALALAAEAGRAVVVHGPAGCGKSRLMHHHLDGRDERVTVVTATSAAASVQLGAFLSVLPEVLPADPLARLHAAAERLVASADVLAVDDAHLLDATSAALVLHVATSGQVRVIATIRTGASAPDAVDALSKDGLAVGVAVGVLSWRATLDLAARALGGSLSDVAAQAIWDRTAGNPLALREVLASTLEAGLLEFADGAWHVTGSLPVPEALHALVASRLAGLAVDERDALELVALADPAPAELITSLGISPACERLETRGLLDARPVNGVVVVRPEHPLHGEVIRAALPTLRRRRHVERLAGAVGSVAGIDPIRAATWQLDSGQPGDPALLRAASELARPIDPALGVRFSRAAVEVAADGISYAVLAEALVRAGRVAEAEQALDDGERVASGDAALSRLATAATHWVGVAGGDFKGALTRAERLRSRVDGRAASDRIDVGVALVANMAGDVRSADDAAERVMAGAESSDETIVIALGVQTAARIAAGRSTGVDEGLARAERLARTLHDPVYVHHLAANRVIWNLAEGRMDDALRLASDNLAGSIRTGHEAFATIHGAWRGVALELCGRMDEAAGVLRDAGRSVAHGDAFGFGPYVSAVRSLVEAQRGDIVCAERHLDIGALDRTQDVRLLTWGTRARAWVIALLGAVDDAAELLSDVGQRLAGSGAAVWAACVYHDAVRLGRPGKVASELERLGDEVEPPDSIVRAMADHAVAATADDGASLDLAADRLAAVGLPLRAAEAASQASRAHVRSARRELAARSAVHAGTWLAACPGASTPATAHLSSPLTPREREVAALATRLNSRDIAAKLTVSVRTVDNHLASVYRKLGISGRAELGIELGTSGRAMPAPAGSGPPLSAAGNQR